MGERIFNKLATGHHAQSAGSKPGNTPHPVVIQALREIGIDATDHIPRRLSDQSLDGIDLAVAVCSEEQCPVLPGVKRTNWNLPDPTNRPIKEVRSIRDDIFRRVEQLLIELNKEGA